MTVDQPESTPAVRRFRWVYPFDLPLLLFLLVTFLLSRWKNVPIAWHVMYDPRFDQPLVTVLGCFLCVLLLVRYLLLRRTGVPGRDAFATFRRLLLERVRDPAFYWEFARILLAVKICMVLYSNLKVHLPRINGALYDSQLWAIDRAVHLGLEPARVATVPLLRLLAPAIDGLYVAWYPLHIIFLVHFIFFAPRRRAWWFLSCWILLWAVGIGLALAVPTWGPCYTHKEIYADLLTPQAHKLQAELWGGYEKARTGIGDPGSAYEGVAAFPSLHVGQVVLWTLFSLGAGRFFKFMVGYSVVVLFGSFYLGWHYAVDGYVSAACAAAIWFATRPLFAEPKVAEPKVEAPTPAPAAASPPSTPPSL